MLDVEITNNDYAMRQACMTAEHYVWNGIDSIDKYLGEGYAAKHPELLAAFMRTAARDLHTTMMKAAAQDIRDVLADKLDDIAFASHAIADAISAGNNNGD